MPKAAPKTGEEAIRAIALAYPDSTEDFPWGHSAFKVRGKAFVFMSAEDGVLGISVKLPVTGTMALGLPFAEPTGYGLGKAGWVSASFAKDADVPLPLLRAWIDESYRAVAPKRLVATLDGGPGPKLASSAKVRAAPGRKVETGTTRRARRKG